MERFITLLSLHHSPSFPSLRIHYRPLKANFRDKLITLQLSCWLIGRKAFMAGKPKWTTERRKKHWDVPSFYLTFFLVFLAVFSVFLSPGSLFPSSLLNVGWCEKSLSHVMQSDKSSLHFTQATWWLWRSRISPWKKVLTTGWRFTSRWDEIHSRRRSSVTSPHTATTITVCNTYIISYTIHILLNLDISLATKVYDIFNLIIKVYCYKTPGKDLSK